MRQEFDVCLASHFVDPVTGAGMPHPLLACSHSRGWETNMEQEGGEAKFDCEQFLADLDAVRARLQVTLPARRAARRGGFSVDLARLGPLLDAATYSARDRAKVLLEEEKRRSPNSPLFNPVSLFAATGYLRLETAHTQSLAWLLDARQVHGFGDNLFDAFLDAVDCGDASAVTETRERIRHTRSGLTRMFSEHRVEGGRADLYAEGVLANGETWSLVVEVKVDAAERTNQLSDYYRHGATNALHVFLTPRGVRGKTAGVNGDWATLSFSELARAFFVSHLPLTGLPGSGFLQTYVTGLLRDFCGIHCSERPNAILARTSPYRIEALLGDRHVDRT
jgi:hypothetical protein